MRILLVGNYGPDRQASMSRYAELLKEHLSARGHDVRLIRPHVYVGRVANSGTFQKWLGYFDKFCIFPLVLMRQAAGYDVVHICDHSNAMYLKWIDRDRASITCHDVLAIASSLDLIAGQKTSYTGKVLQRWIRTWLGRASHTVCVSDKTRNELLHLAPNMNRNCTVIPNPLNDRYTRSSTAEIERLRSRLGLQPTTDYLVHVGGNQWYKNRFGVLQIYRELLRLKLSAEAEAPRLLMVGKPFTVELREFIKLHQLERYVLELTTVSNQELAVIYSGAQALIFPSLAEGFGWPVIEAQSCGCPVITSELSPMLEVSGGAALFIDPLNPAGAAKLIADFNDRLQGLASAGIENASKFSPERLIPSYERFFSTVCRGGH